MAQYFDLFDTINFEQEHPLYFKQNHQIRKRDWLLTNQESCGFEGKNVQFECAGQQESLKFVQQA